MLFNSLIFVVFASVFFLIFRRVKHNTFARLTFIVIMSAFFYGWWDWWYLLLLFGTGWIDYTAAKLMVAYPARRKLLLWFSMLMNLGVLGAFKYSAFFASNINLLLNADSKIPVVQYALPLGISFYTFQSMSYTIDVYRGHCAPARNLLHFFAGLLLFPQLVAGPVLRASQILPQLLEEPHTTEAQRWDGLKLIVHGYFKKLVIADNLSYAIVGAFGGISLPQSSAYWWMIVSMFAFQIYCDFSGYTDIARGLAKWMGYEFPLNFNHPYAATSLRDFWARWHISLSTWFRDYVYIPMGGSKCGPIRAHFNMWTSMLLSGFWHGADWKFIIWGALHAAYLSLERITAWPALLVRNPVGRVIATVFVLLQVWVAWVFFRAESTAQALQIIRIMFSFSSDAYPNLQPQLSFLVLGAVYELFMALKPEIDSNRRGRWMDWLEPARIALLVTVCIFLRGPAQIKFIYFQF
ncbi:MAG TPA: MBOAT family O-acyltransferase [Planctomycetota bacterium]|nr:MBOAT family O-acyltransferase [Planctomycetota bacterium]